MPTETTYTSLRENLASILDRVVDEQDTVIVRRKGARDVALLPASELAGLLETAHLLRSHRNTQRLQSALKRADRGKANPSSVAALRREILGEEKGERAVVFHPEFRQDLKHWVNTDRNVALRILDSVEAVCRDPFQGTGKPEPLKYTLAGCWSRRITQEHRLVYKVSDTRSDFLQEHYHY